MSKDLKQVEDVNLGHALSKTHKGTDRDPLKEFEVSSFDETKAKMPTSEKMESLIKTQNPMDPMLLLLPRTAQTFLLLTKVMKTFIFRKSRGFLTLIRFQDSQEEKNGIAISFYCFFLNGSGGGNDSVGS